MDPSSISPAPPPAANTVPFTTEPNNNHPPSSSSALTHPPYADMIYTAIQELKEKDGSSKIAIGRYIEQVYKDQLPPTHSTLLTHHLKRLKSSGLLEMVKKSYKLPRSALDPSASASASAPPQFPDAPPSSRPRGRPRKTPSQPQPQLIPPNNNNNANAEPVWAALGLADDPAPVQSVPTDEGFKKRPGRPRKSVGPGLAQAVSGQALTPSGRGRGRPPGSKSKKRLGRPPKAETTVTDSGLPKRRPGRPPKNEQTQPTPIPFAAPAPAAEDSTAVIDAPAELTVAPVEGQRSRGRPRKSAVAGVAAAVAAVFSGRGRGRGAGGGGRGRGRGRGGSTVQPSIAGRRPVGRPRKGTTHASAPQTTANKDLKRKLEHFQAKVKESVAVLRPHFNHESPVTAIAAIQELEELGAMDLDAPLRDETLPQEEQPPQQDQLPPQQHLAPQQLPPEPQQYQQQLTEFHIQQYHQQHQLQFQQQPQVFQQPPQQQFHP